MNRAGEKGSVLIIIMVGIILFAALSYVVSQMVRSGGSSVGLMDQKKQLYANEIINYARSIREAVQNVRISGCSLQEISFENGNLEDYEHEPPVPQNCQVFHPLGGGINYQEPPPDWLDRAEGRSSNIYGQWFFPADVCVPDIGTGSADFDCNSDSENNEELIAVLPFIREDICKEINGSIGVTKNGDPAPQEKDSAWLPGNTKYRGEMTDGERLDQNGLMQGCFEGSGSNTPESGTYHYFQVLLPQ